MKILATMFVGWLYAGKRYVPLQYVVGLGVMLGVTVFKLYDPATTSKEDHANTMYGFLLMGLYLLGDAATSTYQSVLFTRFKATSDQMMGNVNLISGCFTLFGLVINLSLFDAIGFIMRYPRVIVPILALSLSGAVGQVFIFRTIKMFGAVVLSMSMVTRQFIAVLLSSVLFMHPIAPMQWLGVGFVFASVGADVRRKWMLQVAKNRAKAIPTHHSK